MRKSILKQLYDGDIYPAEAIVPREPDYRKLCRESERLAEKFRKGLMPEDKKQIEEIAQLEKRIANMQTFESFAYGFRLGTALMTDIISANIDAV